MTNKRLKAGNKGFQVTGTNPTKRESESSASPKVKSNSPFLKRNDKVKPVLNVIEEPKEFENIAGYVATLSNSTNWKARVDSIDSLMSLAEFHAEALKDSSKFIAVLDALAKSLNDTNVKVSLKAVEVLEKFVPNFKTKIEQNVTILLSCLANNLCSTNTTLKNKADILIDLLIDTVENIFLIQPFVHLISFGNARAKSILILHLCGK